MTHEQIREAAENYAKENAQDDYIGYAETDFQKGAETALTHGWNKPDVLPKIKEDYESVAILFICDNFDYTISGYYDGTYFNDGGEEYDVSCILYWRYDNASDIIELLKEKGV